MYVDNYSGEILRKLNKLKRKNLVHYQLLMKKINWILNNPEHKFKILHYNMKNFKRIHIGPFVLTFKINHERKIVLFDDYDHHDRIYR